MSERESIEFYEDYIRKFPQYNHNIWQRCEVEAYRNELTKFFKLPQGHRWQFKEWFEIQDVAFKILIEKGKITEEEYNFYCKRFKI